MILLGYRARYDGPFGDVPVIQAGAFKIIDIKKDYKALPVDLMILMILAKEGGADFLVIDEKAHDHEIVNWIDTRIAA